MRRITTSLLLAGALGATLPSAGSAQFLPVGAEAPNITFEGATRHGVIEGQKQLSDYAGETVVLAFFFRARTRG